MNSVYDEIFKCHIKAMLKLNNDFPDERNIYKIRGFRSLDVSLVWVRTHITNGIDK